MPNAAERPSRKTGFDTAATLAPALINAFNMSAWPWSAACINAVVPRSVSLAFTSAPCSSNACAASTCPERAASISGRRPSGNGSLASAPPLSNARITAASPRVAASHSGLLFSAEAAEQVHAGLSALSIPHREVLTLHFLEDLSVEETATVLGVPPGTVKSRLYYAKRALRDVLERGGAG